MITVHYLRPENGEEVVDGTKCSSAISRAIADQLMTEAKIESIRRREESNTY